MITDAKLAAATARFAAAFPDLAAGAGILAQRVASGAPVSVPALASKPAPAASASVSDSTLRAELAEAKAALKAATARAEAAEKRVITESARTSQRLESLEAASRLERLKLTGSESIPELEARLAGAHDAEEKAVLTKAIKQTKGAISCGSRSIARIGAQIGGQTFHKLEWPKRSA